MARFANRIKLAEHFFDHGADFGAATEFDYLNLAIRFLTSVPPIGATLECKRKRGDRIRFDPVTNEFGVLAGDGVTIRTYYKSNPARHRMATNEEYFRRECSK